MNKRVIIVSALSFFLLLILIIWLKNPNSNTKAAKEYQENQETASSSNIIKDVVYFSEDNKGNTYKITANEGQIDFVDYNTIFLTEVKAVINLKNSDKIVISSNFGKYNINNYDTIFSKNVIIKYLNNKIEAEYLDFSYDRNLMLISRNVIYNNNTARLKADVIEINIMTRDTKIFMYEKEKKINIKNKILNCNN